MGRRYRSRYGPKPQTKWQDNRQMAANDLNINLSRDDNTRQIRFTSKEGQSSSGGGNRFGFNSSQSFLRRDVGPNERNDRSFNNWAKPRGRGPGGQRGPNARRNMSYKRSGQAMNQMNDRYRDDADSQWFKITVPHGNKMDKQTLLQLIHDSMQLAFTPYNYHTEGNAIVFFVLGLETADALKAISRKISAPSGHKLIVVVNRSAIPPTPIDEELTNTIKLVMSQRYDANNKVMDLSRLRDDSNLQSLGLYVSLSRPNMLNTVITIIIENTADIVGLNLKDNKLSSLEPLVKLANVCEALKAIDLSQNQIRNTSELDFIKGLELIELALEGNPICETFEDQAVYISYIRTRFAKLLKLDSEDLPAAIGFDVQETSNLPQTKDGHLPNDIKDFIHGFFEAFYNIYDSDDRQGLLQAYHDQALFSLSISRQDNSHRFAEKQIQESRNLLRVKDIAHRNKLLKSGKIQIVSALCDMPLTRHEADSFQIDVPFCNNAFVLVVVNGVYRELIKKAQPLRAFCRTFYIVPQGSGFVIVNDLLVLTNATVAQIQKYGKTVASVGASDKAMSDTTESTTKWKGGPGVGVSGGAHALTSPTINVNEDVIQRFMALTHMNRSFATQCLEENGFNIDKAFEVYMGLKAQNAIPSEAFVH